MEKYSLSSLCVCVDLRIYRYTYFLEIPQGYSKKENKFCNEREAETYGYLEDAAKACTPMITCKWIFDDGCNGDNGYKLCSVMSSSTLMFSYDGSCVYAQGNY